MKQPLHPGRVSEAWQLHRTRKWWISQSGGCSDPVEEIILSDHVSIVAIAGTVVDESSTGVRDILVSVIRGGENCQNMPYGNLPSDTARTETNGGFVVTATFGLGPLGPGYFAACLAS